jgi:polyketide synthase PksN
MAPAKPTVPARQATAAAAPVVASHEEPIAIIGMSGRFPQARNVAEMWTILVQGREAVTEIPEDRFDWRLYYGDPAAGKTTGRWSGCVPGVREFDALFFHISPREAETMDPRQRLLLQEAWNALEDAGYGRKQIEANCIGMFVGAEQGDYQQLAGMAGGVTASHDGVLAARLAYFLNLRGPNMAINTACSAGLVAAHQACLSLRAGECTTAIAAGVHLLLTPGQLVGMSMAGMLSPDGHCYAFDRRANGLVPGEAVAVVVLKRLSQAKPTAIPSTP